MTTPTPTPDRSAELMLLGQIHGIVQGLHIGAYGAARLRSVTT